MTSTASSQSLNIRPHLMGMGMPGGLIPAGGRNTCAVGTSATAAGSSGYARTSRP